MYMAGLLRTASRPSSTFMLSAVYSIYSSQKEGFVRTGSIPHHQNKFQITITKHQIISNIRNNAFQTLLPLNYWILEFGCYLALEIWSLHTHRHDNTLVIFIALFFDQART